MCLLKCFFKFILVVSIIFNITAPASGWELRNPSGPFDAEMARSIKQWRRLHNWDLSTLLTPSQQVTFDNLVRGTLNWAYTKGNTFNSEAFLNSFTDRDDSVFIVPYPDGGLGLVLRGAYIRIALDRSRPAVPGLDSVELWPEGGRWYAEIGCSSHSQIFYFLAATRSQKGPTASQIMPATESQQ